MMRAGVSDQPALPHKVIHHFNKVSVELALINADDVILVNAAWNASNVLLQRKTRRTAPKSPRGSRPQSRAASLDHGSMHGPRCKQQAENECRHASPTAHHL
jgi:hypothetical protein